MKVAPSEEGAFFTLPYLAGPYRDMLNHAGRSPKRPTCHSPYADKLHETMRNFT